MGKGRCSSFFAKQSLTSSAGGAPSVRLGRVLANIAETTLAVARRRWLHGWELARLAILVLRAPAASAAGKCSYEEKRLM